MIIVNTTTGKIQEISMLEICQGVNRGNQFSDDEYLYENYTQYLQNKKEIQCLQQILSMAQKYIQKYVVVVGKIQITTKQMTLNI